MRQLILKAATVAALGFGLAAPQPVLAQAKNFDLQSVFGLQGPRSGRAR